jgi:hypothetical protein
MVMETCGYVDVFIKNNDMIKSDNIRFQKTEVSSSFLLVMLMACLSFSSAFAQSPQKHATMADTLELAPGIIHVNILVKVIQGHQATFEIMEVLAEGQGIVNVLSKGQLITISIPEKVKLRKGKKMEAYLREMAGVDASQSSYSWLRGKSL